MGARAVERETEVQIGNRIRSGTRSPTRSGTRSPTRHGTRSRTPDGNRNQTRNGIRNGIPRKMIGGRRIGVMTEEMHGHPRARAMVRAPARALLIPHGRHYLQRATPRIAGARAEAKAEDQSVTMRSEAQLPSLPFQGEVFVAVIMTERIVSLLRSARELQTEALP